MLEMHREGRARAPSWDWERTGRSAAGWRRGGIRAPGCGGMRNKGTAAGRAGIDYSIPVFLWNYLLAGVGGPFVWDILGRMRGTTQDAGETPGISAGKAIQTSNPSVASLISSPGFFWFFLLPCFSFLSNEFFPSQSLTFPCTASSGASQKFLGVASSSRVRESKLGAAGEFPALGASSFFLGFPSGGSERSEAERWGFLTARGSFPGIHPCVSSSGFSRK